MHALRAFIELGGGSAVSIRRQRGGINDSDWAPFIESQSRLPSVPLVRMTAETAISRNGPTGSSRWFVFVVLKIVLEASLSEIGEWGVSLVWPRRVREGTFGVVMT